MKKGWIVFLFIALIVSQILVLIAFERQRSITGALFFKIFKAPGILQGLGKVALSVFGRFVIIIYSPQPITYFNQTIDLNVSASVPINAWWFTLRRLSGNCQGEIVYNGAGFVPNITFIAVRGYNELMVYANSTDGITENASVIFNVSVPNLAPIILINDSFFVCENNEFSAFFKVVDENFDCFDNDEDIKVNETPPFYTFVHGRFFNTTNAELFSGVLDKSMVGLHALKITANDGENVAEKDVNVSVLPVNNAPVIVSIPITTLEVYNNTNTSFYYAIQAIDIEDGGTSSGNLSFNLSFILGNSFFSINETYGIINFTYNFSDLGVYRVRICVHDRGLVVPAESFTYCGETGENKSTCFDWDFAITYVNRPPNITDYSNTKTGKNLSLEVNIGELVMFNVSAVDPDGNTPYIDWYFDSFFRKRNLTNYDEFVFVPRVEDVGEHKLYGIATDLLLNDSVVWNITVIGPPILPPSGGGGGPGGAAAVGGGECAVKWGCEEWSTCQNASFYGNDSIKDICNIFHLPEENCGFQTRGCIDVHGCNVTARKPKEIQICYFTLFPGCNDGIKNCHNGGCEIFVDCGGPCSRCPSCSDMRQNQGETGVDCGGPCPTCEEIPFFDIRKRVGVAVNFFIFLAILIILFIIYEIIRIRRIRQRYGKKIRKIVRTEIGEKV